MQEQASTLVVSGFVLLPCLMVALALWSVRHAGMRLIVSAVVACAWLALWGGLAAAGVLARFELRPPPLGMMLLCSLAAGLVLGFSKFGARIAQAVPLWVLVLAQGFRLPLELLMHQAAREHVMPNALSFSGYNFDIVTGALAFVVGYSLRRGASPLWGWLWSCYGSLCLLVIGVIAVLSAPQVHAFGPREVNSWVAHWPFVWLPSVLVVFALAGHVIVFRKLAVRGVARSEH
jgi:hypothetical protein